MALTSSWKLTLAVTGDGLTTSYTPAESTVTNPAAPEGIPLFVELTGGVNSIPIPAGAVMVTIYPPPASVVTKTLNGLAVAPGLPVVYGLPAGATAVAITASAPETVKVCFT